MVEQPSCLLMNRIMPTSAQVPGSLICRSQVTRTVARSCCHFSVPPSCLIWDESIRTDCMKLGPCINIRIVGLAWPVRGCDGTAHLKSLYSFWKAQCYDIP